MTSRRASRGSPRCGKPSVSTKPGLTVWTRIPRRPSSTAAVRENASWACFEAEYGPPGAATSPATETTFTTSAGGWSPGRNARTHQTPPR